MRLRFVRRLSVAVVSLAMASCASPPTSPSATAHGAEPAPPGRQLLVVRTEPAAATCSIVQQGAVVATIDATPGVAAVRRDFNPWLLQFATPEQIERFAPIEIACRKDGFLERRMTFPLARGRDVAVEESVDTERYASQQAGRTGAGIALYVTQQVALQMAAIFPYAALPILGGTLLGTAVTGVALSDGRPPEFAYRALPQFFLTPESFPSESECDAYFVSFEKKLEAARVAERARIDAQCRFWPCKPSDASCPDPVCERQRTRADAYFNAELDRIPLLRATARFVITSLPAGTQ